MVPGDSTHRCQKSSFGTGGNNHPVPKEWGRPLFQIFLSAGADLISPPLSSLCLKERAKGSTRARPNAESPRTGGGRRRRRRGGGAEDRRRTADAESYSFLSRWISFVFLSGPPQSVSSLLLPNPSQVVELSKLLGAVPSPLDGCCSTSTRRRSAGRVMACEPRRSAGLAGCQKRGRREGRSACGGGKEERKAMRRARLPP